MKKIIAVMLTAAVLFGMSACGANDPYRGMKPTEKLVAVGTWEKQYSPEVTMSFEKNGKGAQNNDGTEYEFYWELDEGELDIEVIGWWELDYRFEQGEDSFTITNTEAGSSATFVYGGSQPKTLPENGEKPKELEGTWICEDASRSTYVFKGDGSAYTFSPADPAQAHTADLKWTYDKNADTLYTYNDATKHLSFLRYKINGKEMTLTVLASGKEYKYTKAQ